MQKRNPFREDGVHNVMTPVPNKVYFNQRGFIKPISFLGSLSAFN